MSIFAIERDHSVCKVVILHLHSLDDPCKDLKAIGNGNERFLKFLKCFLKMHLSFICEQ